MWVLQKKVRKTGIQSVFNQSGLTVTQFARLLQVQRTRIYNIVPENLADFIKAINKLKQAGVIQ